MNSLLQVLFFIPGFCDGLFSLDLPETAAGVPNFRRIPAELQRLLAVMAELDVASTSTTRLAGRISPFLSISLPFTPCCDN